MDVKANEYFKKHGYRKCKSACAENGWLNTGFWIQLKRLVESHELVESYMGLDMAKHTLSRKHYLDNNSMWKKLEQAILDVENCL